jgi:plastocyanin
VISLIPAARRFPARVAVVVSLALALGSLLAACGGQSTSASPGATAVVTNGVVELHAADLAFDAVTIRAPAGEAFTIRLVNDDSAPHNVAVYEEEGGAQIVIGDIIDASETVDTMVPALDAGTYYFRCDLHPAMEGTVIVEG